MKVSLDKSLLSQIRISVSRAGGSMPTATQALIVQACKLNYFDPTENSNKVWIGTAFDDGTFQTQYGRVREGQKLAQSSKHLQTRTAAIAELEKRCAEKLRKGYRETATIDDGGIVSSASVDLKQVATAQIGGCDDPTTRSLIEYLSEVNIHNIVASTSIRYNAGSGTFRTPLGVLTPSAITEARQLLNSIANQAGYRDRLVSDYFRLVPHDFGIKVPPLQHSGQK